MSIRHLVQHPRWPLYRKCRRAAARELAALGLAADVRDVDAYLERALGAMLEDVRRLYLRDQAAREEWRRTGRRSA